MFPFDIQNIICFYLYDLKDTINLYNLSKDHQNNVRITNLCDIPGKYLNRLTQKIIKQKKLPKSWVFQNIEKLNVSSNEKINNVNHMKKTQVASDGHKSSAC